MKWESMMNHGPIKFSIKSMVKLMVPNSPPHRNMRRWPPSICRGKWPQCFPHFSPPLPAGSARAGCSFTARADSTFCSGSLPSSIQESTWEQFADRISQMLAYGTSKMRTLEFGKSGPSYILIQPYYNRELIFQITFLEFHVTFGWSMFSSNLQSFKIPLLKNWSSEVVQGKICGKPM